jgi:hypothetical protein
MANSALAYWSRSAQTPVVLVRQRSAKLPSAWLKRSSITNTSIALSWPAEKSSRIVSPATLAEVSAGSTRSSMRVSSTFRKGRATTMSSAVTPTATGTGWRMIRSDCRPQNVSSSEVFAARRRTMSLSMRGPSAAKTAGRISTAVSAARPATAIPATANERKYTIGKRKSAASDTATVAAENSTVRPAVCSVRSIARLQG